MSCQWNIFSLNIFLLKQLSSFKFRILNMITVCFRLNRSLKTMARREQVAVQSVPPVSFKLFALVEGANTEFGLPVALKDKSPKSVNFVPLLRTELTRFTRLLGFKSVTTSPVDFSHQFFNAKARQIPFLVRRSGNGSVQWINVP